MLKLTSRCLDKEVSNIPEIVSPWHFDRCTKVHVGRSAAQRLAKFVISWRGRGKAFGLFEPFAFQLRASTSRSELYIYRPAQVLNTHHHVRSHPFASERDKSHPLLNFSNELQPNICPHRREILAGTVTRALHGPILPSTAYHSEPHSRAPGDWLGESPGGTEVAGRGGQKGQREGCTEEGQVEGYVLALCVGSENDS